MVNIELQLQEMMGPSPESLRSILFMDADSFEPLGTVIINCHFGATFHNQKFI